MPRVMSRLFSRRLLQGEHTLHFSVETDPVSGWQVHELRDDTSILQRKYDDWHRVELAMSRFAIEASQLTRDGWREE